MKCQNKHCKEDATCVELFSVNSLKVTIMLCDECMRKTRATSDTPAISLLSIYELITQLQSEIGNGAEVRLYARDNTLETRVDWWDNDFHALDKFPENELLNGTDAKEQLGYFVAWCKTEYAIKKTL